MQQALSLAANGRGAVEPNPMVGCVIVKEGRVIGRGYHERFGGPHAEANALAACAESPAGAMAYVSLEPCCHTNKKTPPCVPRLIEAKLARVVVGCVDPNPAVSGAGIAQLRAAGIEVTFPVLEASAKQINASFIKHVTRGLPYVTLKWAQSSDGKVAGPGGRPVWISNSSSTSVVHQLRGRCDAILVGINTALSDDPLLTARGVRNPRPLTRGVLDRSLRIPDESRLVKTAAEHPLIVFTSPAQMTSGRASELRSLGVQIAEAGLDENGQLSLSDVLADLGRRRVTHLLVEPGPTLAAGFLQSRLADRVWVIRSPTAIGASLAPGAPQVDYPETGSVELDGDRLTEYLNAKSPVCFSIEPSVDFALASHARGSSS